MTFNKQTPRNIEDKKCNLKERYLIQNKDKNKLYQDISHKRNFDKNLNRNNLDNRSKNKINEKSTGYKDIKLNRGSSCDNEKNVKNHSNELILSFYYL